MDSGVMEAETKIDAKPLHRRKTLMDNIRGSLQNVSLLRRNHTLVESKCRDSKKSQDESDNEEEREVFSSNFNSELSLSELM
jgi:serine/threonine protein kinase